jgi:hypothetical protein
MEDGLTHVRVDREYRQSSFWGLAIAVAADKRDDQDEAQESRATHFTNHTFAAADSVTSDIRASAGSELRLDGKLLFSGHVHSLAGKGLLGAVLLCELLARQQPDAVLLG